MPTRRVQVKKPRGVRVNAKLDGADAVARGAAFASIIGGAARIAAWFASRGWTPFDYQLRAWSAYAQDRSGLIHLPTGAGKTYAAAMGPLAAIIDESRATGEPRPVRGLRLIYLTPLRAVARDIEAALTLPIQELGECISIAGRTGDTTQRERAKQRDELPNVLVTTPESLTLMLTRANSAGLLGGVHSVICDEWHELLSSKRGTQTELALARLRRLSPRLRVWALSATIENVDDAARIAVGVNTDETPLIIRGDAPRPVEITSILPASVHDLPWAGHLGLSMLPRVVAELDPARATLVFTNTRSQAEKWYHALRFAKPEWEGLLALHHGSIDRAERERVEHGLKSGALRIVVATSSLDLGVDFSPVERVMQIGSVKGVARLLQRAGRSGHRPGETCRIVCVPTHGLELFEIAAAREAALRGVVEPRLPLNKPLDVLAQHLVTCAIGGGFDADAMFNEVRSAWSFRDLTREEFEWTLALVRDGGGTLGAYPEFHKIAPATTKPNDAPSREHLRPAESVGRGSTFYVGAGDDRARSTRLHRLNVGTITSDGTLDLCYRSGKRIGSIEEYFVTKLQAGQRFYFAGKTLAFIGIKDLTAYVKPANGKATLTPIWGGTRLPISESLGAAVRRTLEDVSNGVYTSAEARAARPLAEIQARLSRVPRADELLAEICRTREGLHLFVYPFDGRLVHSGLAAILALRLARLRSTTFLTAANDYGFELITADDTFPLRQLVTPALFTIDRLGEDAIASVEITQLAKLQFREIARVSGLVFQSHPGARKTARQLQTSSGLIFDVFREFDPRNLLLEQARREVMARQFEESRLVRTVRRLTESKLLLVETDRPTPLSLPLILDRAAARVSTETLMERFQKIRATWES
jgi:ATP-dependent helicase Lhr and Lhr-like helicase